MKRFWDNVKNRFKFTREQWLGIIRHILTSFGPLLAYVGIEISEEVWVALVGAAMTIIGFIWSVKAPEKKNV